MYVIAEVGSNYRDKDDCIESVRKAAECGADAVKFQNFNQKEMYGYGSDEDNLPLEWLPDLFKVAKQNNIDLMCTVFSPKKISLIEPYVAMHKIASSDMEYLELIQAAVSTGKKVLLSTGGHTLDEVRNVVSLVPTKNLVLMYCESVYPARCYDMDKINLLKKFNCVVGVSDHSRELYSVPTTAMLSGAMYLEKHVNFSGVKSDDSPHSLSTSEFRNMISSLKSTGPIEIYSPEEIDMKQKHNRRLVAVSEINKGERLRKGYNFGAFRSKVPFLGLNPSMADVVDETRAITKYKAGDNIRME